MYLAPLLYLAPCASQQRKCSAIEQGFHWVLLQEYGLSFDAWVLSTMQLGAIQQPNRRMIA
jgi:hypothetical protein